MTDLTLASSSKVRADLLRNAGLVFDVVVARVDESSVKAALLATGAPPRDIADALAEAKAQKVSSRGVGGIVIGCDQVLEHDGTLFSKPATLEEARHQLKSLTGAKHRLWTAAVAFEDNEPTWRHVAKVELTMRSTSDAYLDDYLSRNWESVRHSVGGYKLEEEGIRLFTRIEGDYFAVLGIPLLELLSWLTLRGTLPS